MVDRLEFGSEFIFEAYSERTRRSPHLLLLLDEMVGDVTEDAT